MIWFWLTDHPFQQGLAKNCEAFFLSVQPSAVQSKWYGETNKAIQGIFRLARKLSTYGRPCVIFVGERSVMLCKKAKCIQCKKIDSFAY